MDILQNLRTAVKSCKAPFLPAIAGAVFALAGQGFALTTEVYYSAEAAVMPANPRSTPEPLFIPSQSDATATSASHQVYPSAAEWELFYKLLGDASCATCKGGSKSVLAGVNVARTDSFNFSLAADVAERSAGPAVADGNLVSRSPDGTLVITRRIAAPGAAGVRLHLQNFQLQGGAQLFIYSDDGESHGPYTDTGVFKTGPYAGDFWTNTVYADHCYIEVRFPAAATAADIADSKFTLTEIGYLVSDGIDRAAEEVGRTPRMESCIIDGSCAGNSDFSRIDELRKAIGQMLYASEGGMYVCSGGLINTLVYSGTPYFLTANHCLSTADEAASLEVTWRFQTPSCNEGFEDWASNSGFERTLGAQVVSTGHMEGGTDFSLLELEEDPPAGSVFLGWTTRQVPVGTRLYRISHPQGSQQAFSTQVTTNQSPCFSLPPTNFIYSRKGNGATDGGSSGSPVVNGALQIVGQLYGSCGFAIGNPCSTDNYTVDGRFSSTFGKVRQYLGTPPVEPVISTFFYSPYPANAGQPVNFHVIANSPDGKPLTYSYDYGDGATDSLGVRTYNATGDYPVTVSATNGSATVSSTLIVKVQNKAPIISSVTYTPNPVTQFQAVQFNVVASSPLGRALSYSYNYGDGNTDSTGRHAYTQAGIFAATVTVSDGEFSAFHNLSITVEPSTMADLSFGAGSPLMTVKGSKGTLSGSITVANQSSIATPATEMIMFLAEQNGTRISELKRYPVPALAAGASHVIEPGVLLSTKGKKSKSKPIKFKFKKGTATGKSLAFVIDDAGVIAEADETNNTHLSPIATPGQ